MPTRKGSPPDTLPDRSPTALLPDGRVLVAGDELSIPYEGRFRFVYQLHGDKSLTCWGPLPRGTRSKDSMRSSWRSFNPEKIKFTLHRSTPKEGRLKW